MQLIMMFNKKKRLAAGNWLLANCTCCNDDRISIYLILQLATDGWRLANCTCFNDDCISIYLILRLATGCWRLANCTCFDDDRISKYFKIFLFISNVFLSDNLLSPLLQKW